MQIFKRRLVCSVEVINFQLKKLFETVKKLIVNAKPV